MAAQDVSEQLAREDAGRQRAMIAAVLGALLLLGSGALLINASSAPHNDLVAVINDSRYRYTQVIGTAIAGLGYAAVGFVLAYLAVAARARGAAIPAAVITLVRYAPLVYLVGATVAQVLVGVRAHDLVTNGPLTYSESHDLRRTGVVLAVSLVAQLAALGVAFSYITVSLNSMRVGLLTRFMGYIGIFVGILTVLPVLPSPILAFFWLGALAYLLSGRWPSGVPEAWSDGQPHPWATMAEARAAAADEVDAVREPRRGDATPEPPVGDDSGPTGKPHSSSKKRKRKRRH